MPLHKIRKDTKVYDEYHDGNFYYITIMSMYDGKKHFAMHQDKSIALYMVYHSHKKYINNIK